MLDSYHYFILPALMDKYKDYFMKPENRKQILYEALRKSVIEKVPDKEICEIYGLNYNTFRSEKRDFFKAINQGEDYAANFFLESKVGKRAKNNKEMDDKIISLRKKNLSIVDIKAILSGECFNVSLWKIDRILKENDYPPLPKRTRAEKQTVKLSSLIEIPRTQPLQLPLTDRFDSLGGSILLFYPILKELRLDKIIDECDYPETKTLSRQNMILSFLALKLNNTERLSHESDYKIDRGLGLFSGLNVLPKSSTLSSYSYKITRDMNKKFISLLSESVSRLIPESGDYNLDFTTIPHWGDKSVLEKHWSNTRHTGLKSILALLVQDQKERNIVYTDAEIKNNSQSDAILEFVDFYNSSKKKLSCLIFDSKFTTYGNLSKLNRDGIKFITLRRRGLKLISRVMEKSKTEWQKVNLSNQYKRQYRKLLVHDSNVKLKDYDGEIRQIVITNNGRKNPTFLITNDFEIKLKDLILKYGQRWLVEQSISEQIEFFHLNKLGSSIVVKVDFDLTMTLLADTIYKLFTRQISGFEHKKAKTVYRDIIRNHARFTISDKVKTIDIILNKKIHLLLLMNLDWFKNGAVIPWLYNYKLNFRVNNTT